MPLRLRFSTFEFGDLDIHVRTLRNTNEYSDPDGVAEALGISDSMWPIFGVMWDSGVVLAGLMMDYDIKGLRILEVGCGIGLASLVLNHRQADITATDRHPNAEAFLAYNTQLNEGEAIPFVRTSWADEPTDLGRFDLIIGSDLMYDIGHAKQLFDFIAQHAAPTCTVVMVDPGRKLSRTFPRMMEAEGYGHSVTHKDGFGQHTYVREAS